MRSPKGYALALVLALLLFSPFAKGEVTHYNLGLNSEFPFGTGVEGQLVFPDNIRLNIQMGFMTSIYVKGINGLARSAGLYDAAVSTLIEDFIPGNFVLSASIAFDDLLFPGFFIEAGYHFITGRGAVPTAAVLEAALSTTVTGDLSNTTAVGTSIHSATFHVGYRVRPSPPFDLFFRIGIVKPFASSTEFQTTGMGAILLSGLNTELGNFMSRIYRMAAFPTLSVGIVYRFGHENREVREPARARTAGRPQHRARPSVIRH